MNGGDDVGKRKRNKKPLDREEYGYGFDISVDDLAVIGQNQQAKSKMIMKIKTSPIIKIIHPL